MSTDYDHFIAKQKEAVAALESLRVMVHNLSSMSGDPALTTNPTDNPDDPEIWLVRIDKFADIIDKHLIAVGYANEIRRAYDDVLEQAEINRLIGMLERSGAMIPDLLRTLSWSLRIVLRT